MQTSKDEFAAWITEKSQYLNQTHWDRIMNVEQSTALSDKSTRARSLQAIAVEARNDIKKFRTELSNLGVSADLGAVKTKCGAYLDEWDSFFYYMAKYGASGNMDDLGVATRHYKAVDANLQEILGLLGFGTGKTEEPQPPQDANQSSPNNAYPVREKEIMKEKEVIVKIRCPYCHHLYDETLDACPNCGASR